MRSTVLWFVLVLAACGSAADPTSATRGRPATLVAVIDGDSLELQVDGNRIEVRLDGVNAPEGDECFGDEASAALLDVVEGASLSFEATGRDQFGRTLGYVFANDVLVNRRLADTGHVIATSGDHLERDTLLAAEASAIEAGAGLWVPDACGPASGARVAIARIEANPPGDDAERLDLEWIGLVNEGGALDLSGWTLRDESSVHRYRFPTGTTVAPGAGVAVRTGCGSDGGGELHWCADGPVWSNGGDTVILQDTFGNVVAQRRYGP